MVERQIKMEDLSPLGEYKEGMNWNPVEKVILERRSNRSYKKDPLPDSMIRRILEAGRFAPTAGNQQPWKFVIIKSPEILAEMEKDALAMTKKLIKLLEFFPKFMVKKVIKRKYNELHPVPFGALQQIAADQMPVFHNAPTIILILIDKRGVSNPDVDMGIAGQNIVLAAHSMGAATCWVGFIKVLLYKKKWKKFFGMKWPYQLTDCITIGWPKTRFDGLVPREVQLVEWFEGGMKDKPRIERQGE